MEAGVEAWRVYAGFLSDLVSAAYIVNLCDLVASARVCAWYRQNLRRPVSWHQSLIVVLLVHFGGTTLAGILTGKMPSWLQSFEPLAAVVVSWYLTFFSPADWFWKMYQVEWVNVSSFCLHGWVSERVRRLQRGCAVIEAMNLANSIGNMGVGIVLARARTRPVDLYRQPSITLGWVCGVLTGCGGGLLAEMGNLLDDPLPHGKRPQAAHRRRFVRALLGSTFVVWAAWPRTGKLIDFDECDADAAVVWLSIALALDSTGMLPDVVYWPLEMLGWLLPNFRAVFIPSMAMLANNSHGTLEKIRQHIADPSRIASFQLPRIHSDSSLMPYVNDKGVQREVLQQSAHELERFEIDAQAAEEYVEAVLSLSRESASELLERQCAEQAQHVLVQQRLAQPVSKRTSSRVRKRK
jgi:hypothetical protein